MSREPAEPPNAVELRARHGAVHSHANIPPFTHYGTGDEGRIRAGRSPLAELDIAGLAVLRRRNWNAVPLPRQRAAAEKWLVSRR